jgi:hypothetical protein
MSFASASVHFIVSIETYTHDLKEDLFARHIVATDSNGDEFDLILFSKKSLSDLDIKEREK